MVRKTRSRVIIENVQPEIDGGEFAAKRIIGDTVVVEARVFTDGHDQVKAALLYKKEGQEKWSTVPMEPLGNDRWVASFKVRTIGEYRFTVRAWIDHFKTWRTDLGKRIDAGQDISVELLIGANLIEDAAKRAEAADAKILQTTVRKLRGKSSIGEKTGEALDEEVFQLVSRYPDLGYATSYPRELPIMVDREKARFSTWYELFPRSCATEPGRHGTFRDLEDRLPYIASMGFDVLYLPPIHPIGIQFRKGKNNTLTPGPDDVGSPWAIGGKEGGHKSILPELGTLEDFRRLVTKVEEHGLELALDIAYQCTPDHPYVKAHPEWFRSRPDGTIQYAENPPKKYQDIYPINFESSDWEALWDELLSILLYWIEQGIRIFRVDNPHTKAFGFWEWAIAEVKRDYPEVIFLAEAFTRPAVMYRLAKLGYTQSYTYFTWRNGKDELTRYLTELTQTPVKEFFRPNFWPNTPDILHEYLQHGGRPAFMVRYVLAATLTASMGIYGPAFELCAATPRDPGSEEYLDSEKYQIRQWNLEDPGSLRDFIAQVNTIRKTNAALQNNDSLRFHPIDNDQMICYSKRTPDASNSIIVVANLDPYHVQSGWVDLPLDHFGLDWEKTYQVHDLLSEARYRWHGGRNFVQLNPHVVPAHIFRVRHRVRNEKDFDYFL